MSLDVRLSLPPCAHCGRGDELVYEANVTHNLGAMARVAGLYEALWRPEEIGVETAGQIAPRLRAGLAWLRVHRSEAEQQNAPNGWGTYVDFVSFVVNYLAACAQYPAALVSVSR